jgi:hypothetical protein
MTDASRPAEKPPEEWVTGDEPMTGPQASYLSTLAREAGEDVPDGLTKAQASEMIERLQAATGRGAPASGGANEEIDESGPTEFGDAVEE